MYIPLKRISRVLLSPFYIKTLEKNQQVGQNTLFLYQYKLRGIVKETPDFKEKDKIFLRRGLDKLMKRGPTDNY